MAVKPAKRTPSDSASTRKSSGRKPSGVHKQAAARKRVKKKTPSRGRPARTPARIELAENKGRPANQVRNVDSDWIQKRLRSQHKSQRMLAAAWGGKSASIVTRVLRDNRRMSLDEFMTLCEFLKVSPQELLPRLGYEAQDDSATVTVAGAVTEGARVTFVSTSTGRRMPIPRAPNGLKALLIEEGDGAIRAYKDSIILYRQVEPEAPLLFDRMCVIEVIGEVVPIVGVLSKDDAGKLYLRRLASPEVAPVGEVLRTHPIYSVTTPEGPQS